MKIDRRSKEYRWWRFGVFLKDEGICQSCGHDDDLQAHHINSAKYHPDQAYDINNGVLLCGWCHRFLHIMICGGYAEFCNFVHLELLTQMNYHMRITRRKLGRVLKKFNRSK